MNAFRSTPLTVLVVISLALGGVSVPVPAQAAYPVTEVGADLFQNTITAIKSTITAIAAPISAAAEVALQVDKYVLQPLAFVVSGQLLQAILGDVLKFVNGVTNGTGEPQFVQDYNGNLQRVGDTQAYSFIGSYSRNSNSPFAGAISSSLRTNYLERTSTGGFFAANRSTLGQSSPNINRFLSGDWSQGGAGAWFALTTQSHNNPYTLYGRSQSQLSVQVYGAQNARAKQIDQGRGYFDWCGPFAAPAEALGPHDPCIAPDGTTRQSLTPGAAIERTVGESITSPIRKLEGLGELGREVGSVASNMGKILQTIGTGVILFNTFSGKGATSYYASSQGGQTSYVAQYRSNPSYLGVSQAGVFNSAADIPPSGSSLLDRVQLYETSWNAIRSSVEAAASSVNELARVCRAQATLARQNASGDPALLQFAVAADELAAQADLTATSTIRVARERVAQAATTTAAARALVAKTQGQLRSGTTSPETVGNYTDDLLTLQSVPPSATDVADALQESQAFGTAAGDGLAVSGSTLLDRMNKLNGNATSLKTSVCTIPSSTPSP